MTSKSRSARRAIAREAQKQCRTNPLNILAGNGRGISVRAANLPKVVSYKTVILYRPANVPADDKRWMGRNFKYKDVKQVKRVSSGSIPDFRTINNDTTRNVIAKNAKAALRYRGEML